MSFFIKKKHNAPTRNKYEKTKVRKRKFTKAVEEDELTSSSEDEISKTIENNVESSEDEYETPQEKKLRLAKAYLQEIEKREREKYASELNKDENDVNDNSIAKILKEDYLKSIGKLQKKIASNYVGADTENTRILKCKEHRSSITYFCLTEKFIFSGSKDGSVVKWSIDECKKINSIRYCKKSTSSDKITGHSSGITSIAITTDNKFLAISDNSKDIQIWDPDTLNHVNTLTGHQKTVTGLVFRKGSHTLYSCGKDRSVKVWSLDDMAYVETLYGHQYPITFIDALTRERAVTSGGLDGTIRIWKIVEESQLIYNCHSSNIDIVKLLNEETFVSGGDDGTINVWGVNKKKPLCIYKNAHGANPVNGEPYWICSLATLLNTDLVASGSQDGFIKLWKLSDNFRTIELLFTIKVDGFINCINFTEDGNFLIAAVGTEHKMGRWNVIKTVKNSIVKIPLQQNSI